MKRIIIGLAIIFHAAAAFGVTDRPFRSLNRQQAPAVSFNFSVVGDFRPAKWGMAYPEVFRQELASIEKQGSAFLVSTGDAYFGYGGTMTDFQREVDGLLAIAAEAKMPFFNVIGNHDVADEKAREAYVKEKVGALFGAMDYAGSHFVFLDTDEVGKRGSITGDQLRWLEKDLEENRQAENIFVFMHRPLFSVEDPELARGRAFADRANRDYLHRLFVRHGVRAVFAGHEHLYDRKVKDGVTYYITGGGGAPLSSMSAAAFFHFLLVRVKGKEIQVQVLAPDGHPVFGETRGMAR